MYLFFSMGRRMSVVRSMTIITLVLQHFQKIFGSHLQFKTLSPPLLMRFYYLNKGVLIFSKCSFLLYTKRNVCISVMWASLSFFVIVYEYCQRYRSQNLWIFRKFNVLMLNLQIFFWRSDFRYQKLWKTCVIKTETFNSMGSSKAKYGS